MALFPRISLWPDLITDRNVAAVAISVLVLMAQSCTTLSVQQKMVNVLPHPSDEAEEITITPTSKKPATPPIIKVHTGNASWYGPGFKGKKTASGEIFDPAKFTAAHKTFPLGSRARVTHLDNGKSVEVEINDRGPYALGRIIDLSHAAARALDMVENGVAAVRVELISEVSAAGDAEATK